MSDCSELYIYLGERSRPRCRLFMMFEDSIGTTTARISPS